MADQSNIKSRTLQQWLNWMEKCHPAEIELGLDRVRQVADRLQIDLSASRVVTIAGTNGKGSTVRYLQTIYRKAGFRVGCYTSPHFLHYNERVELDGNPVSDSLLCDAFARIDQARGEVPLTYFEFGTLAALLIFTDARPDLILLEVGLGGRLDAVNIIDPDIAVVTTVGLDHQDWLGDDREAIGREKAGIFRAGKPAICGDPQPPASLLLFASELGCPLYRSGMDFSCRSTSNSIYWQGRTLSGEPAVLGEVPLPQLPLANAATALQVCHLLDLPVTEQAMRSGIAEARLTGRMQQLDRAGRNIWLDVAHNPEAAGLLARRMSEMGEKCDLILGMLRDKDYAEVIRILAPQVRHWYLVSLDVPRGATADELAGQLPENALVSRFPSVAEAWNSISHAENGADNVIIAGSFYTVAEALQILERD